jgi:glyoxylase-like metal-dependent hydrolase (beta-lactamase superfamily II)
VELAVAGDASVDNWKVAGDASVDNWKIGAIHVTRILEMCDPMRTPAQWFPDSTPEAIDPHLHWLIPRSISPVDGRIILPIQSFLVQTSRHTILVDSCVGNNKTCDYFAPWQGRTESTFLNQLANAGVAPEQIDYVLCTHLHIDHCGWNTRLLNGRWVPTFPNARYVIARREFEAAEATAGGGNGDRIYEESVLPIVEAGRAVLVDMDHALDDEVWLEPTPGHTAGHIAIRIRSQGVEAVFSGDLMHWPMQCIHPNWNFRYDAHPEQAHQTRRAFLEACADNGSTVITSHFPLPSVGTIARRQQSFWFDDRRFH